MQKYAGAFLHNLDKNYRLAIPSKFHHHLGEEFMVYKPLNGTKCLYLYSGDDWEMAVAEVFSELKGSELNDTQRRLYMNIASATLDKQGRATIGKNFCEFAGLEKEVIVLGVWKRVEIWNPDEYDKQQKRNEEKLALGGRTTKIHLSI